MTYCGLAALFCFFENAERQRGEGLADCIYRTPNSRDGEGCFSVYCNARACGESKTAEQSPTVIRERQPVKVALLHICGLCFREKYVSDSVIPHIGLVAQNCGQTAKNRLTAVKFRF